MRPLVFILMFASFRLLAQGDTLELLQKGLEVSQTTEDRIDLLNRLSHAYTQVSLPTAEQFANSALELALPFGYQKGIATSYNNLGICYSIKGEYTAGLDYFIKALQIREQLKDPVGVARTLNNISRVFIYQRDFDKALEYSRQSLDILAKVDDPEAVGNAHMVLGSIYLSKKDYKSAQQMYAKARALFSSKHLATQEGAVLMNIANVYEAEGNHDMALQTCNEAQRLLDQGMDIFTRIELFQTIGLIYTRMGDRKEASGYLHRAIRMADENNVSNGRLTSRATLAEMFKTFSQFDSALYYQEAYQKLHEEIFNTERSNQIAALEKVYQTERKDRILAAKNYQIRSQNVVIAIISILLVVLLALGILLYKYSRNKRRSAQELKKLNREIYEKHEEILAQSEELAEVNEEMRRINESLEQEVSARAERIKKQNETLIEYAYFNAHNVRAPLARILGLAALMANESSPLTIQEYNTYMLRSAQELDQIVQEINRKLEAEV